MDWRCVVNVWRGFSGRLSVVFMQWIHYAEGGHAASVLPPLHEPAGPRWISTWAMHPLEAPMVVLQAVEANRGFSMGPGLRALQLGSEAEQG